MGCAIMLGLHSRHKTDQRVLVCDTTCGTRCPHPPDRISQDPVELPVAAVVNMVILIVLARFVALALAHIRRAQRHVH
ncbi:MAG: hypothetical protein N4A61_11155 [Pelagimonas sp.]|nr:hypothetical protein [Pelagimonas sp.]